MKQVKFNGFWLLVLCVLGTLLACEKLYDGVDDEPYLESARFQLSIGDARSVLLNKKSNVSEFDPAKLSVFEVTFSDIQLRSLTGELQSVLGGPVTVDLRQFRGEVQELIPIKIPVGIYTGFRVRISGLTARYDTVSYMANAAGVSLFLGEAAGSVSLTTDNPFSSAIEAEVPIQLAITEEADAHNVRLHFDVETSCMLASTDTPSHGSVQFVQLREQLSMAATLENGIQQIAYSPPVDIRALSMNDVYYHSLHRFMDFDQLGGKLIGHRSQHVFRGEDAQLLVDAEEMQENTSMLDRDDIDSLQPTLVRADEVFRYEDLAHNLSEKGYTLESGKVYYFSLRKVWYMQTNGKSYVLNRLCEAVPVYWP